MENFRKKAMKNFLKIIPLILLSCVFLFSSCENDDTPNGALNFEAKINGTEWKGSGNSRVVGVGNIVSTAIGAGKSDRSAISLTVMNDKAGSYNLAGNASYTDANQVVYIASSGNVNITSFEGNKVSGTFSFVARPATGGGSEIQVTDGKFTDINVSR
jgi:hypothetical protein